MRMTKLSYNCLPGQRRGRNSGSTLVEVMLTFGVAGIVLAALGTLSSFMARSFSAVGNYADLNQSSRQTLDVMIQDIRQAKTVVSFATNQLVLNDLTNGTFSYTWNRAAGTVTRVYNGQSKVVLRGCDYLAFHISQRTPSNNFNFWPASSPSDAKLIDVSWNCSRPLVGQLNTESIQTAKITIRN